MKNKTGIWINLIGIIILIGLLIFGVGEADKCINKVNWEPTEVYEFTNKHIDWS